MNNPLSKIKKYFNSVGRISVGVIFLLAILFSILKYSTPQNPTLIILIAAISFSLIFFLTSFLAMYAFHRAYKVIEESEESEEISYSLARSVFSWISISWVLFILFFGTFYYYNSIPLGITIIQPANASYKTTPLDYYYFSAITATTVGYGDFYPGGLYAKIIASTQAFLGYIFLGVSVALIAVLINKKLLTHKLFKCPYCGVEFDTAQDLKIHLGRKHKLKP